MSHLFYERHGGKITLAGALLLPFVVVFGIQALLSNANEVSDWLPSDYPETVDYKWFRARFRYDEFALVSWEGCTLDDERLDRFQDELNSGRLPVDGKGNSRFPRVATGRSALRDLMDGANPPTRDEAIAKLKNALVGPDGRQTCAISFLTPEARSDVHATLAAIHTALDVAGVPVADRRIGGPPALNAAIDEVSNRSINKVVVIACFVVTCVAWFLIRDLVPMLLVLIAGLYSAGIGLAVVRLTGGQMNAVLITMVPMIYVAATSGAIHLCNYYLESAREGGAEGAAGRAVAHAWVPLGLATGTTAAGLLSICYTDLTLVRQFGVYSAAGVLLSWVLLVAWLPAALTALRRKTPAAAKTADAAPRSTGEAPLPAFWLRLGELVIGRPHWFLAGSLVVWIAAAPGLRHMDVTIDLMQEFRPEAEIIQTYRWFERNLGPLNPLEVVLRMNEDCPLNVSQRARLVERIQRRLERLPEAGGSMSAATFVSEIQSGSIFRRGIAGKKLEEQRTRLQDTGYLLDSDGEELWRISLRVQALADVNYTQFFEKVRAEIEDELDADPERGRAGLRATITGVAPVLYKARLSLVDGLYWGIVTDLALIVVSVLVALRHWSNGLLMTFLSLFPTFVVLGTVGWLGIRLDLGAIMAPCVALGVTVDDVIHFLLWFREGARKGLDRRDATRLAWRACVRPMYQSWTLLGLGMSSLLLSEFLPILQFGAVMVAMLTVGLAGNLFFLASLLAGPLGAIMVKRLRPQAAAGVEPVAIESIPAESIPAEPLAVAPIAQPIQPLAGSE